MNVTWAVALALAKGQSEEQLRAARAAASVGEHEFDALVRVRGRVRVGEDYEQRVAAAVNPWALAALAIGKLSGATVEALVREYVAAVDADRLGEDVKARAASAIETLVERTRRTVHGKVVVAAVFEEVAREEPSSVHL